MKIMAYLKIYVISFCIFAICVEKIRSFELTQKNKELYLDCIKLKQEIGNENIQCEKILLDNIKKNLNNKVIAEGPKKKPKTEDYEEINKSNINNSKSNQPQDKDDFNIDDYVERIEKFIEGEINHLNKFKFFIGDFKEKSKKFTALSKFRKNLLPINTLNPSSNEEKESVQNTKEESQNSILDNMNIINKLRGSLKNKKSFENTDELNENQQETKKQIKFKQTRSNESNRDAEEDNSENDFSKLKERFKLASESHKEEKFSASKDKEYNKKASNDDLDSVQALISKLKNNKIKKKEEAKPNSNLEENEQSNKDPKLELLSKLKSLGLNINKGNQEATNNLFKKFLDESVNKAKNAVGNKNDDRVKDENLTKQMNFEKEDSKKIKNLEDFDINDIGESLAKLKNEKRRGNGDVSNSVHSENKTENNKKKKNQSSIVDISDNLNLDSLKNLINNADQKKKNNNEAAIKKENVKGINSTENEDADKTKSNKSDKLEDKKENKKTDFNFSLGEIESQIEMLKNLSIKP